MKSPFDRTNKLPYTSKTFFFAFIFLLIAETSISQHPDTVITLNRDIEVVTIKNVAAGYLPVSFDIGTGYDKNILSRKPLKSPSINASNVSKKIIHRFSVINEGDKTDSLYFFPGFFFSNVLLYKIETDKALPLPVIAPPMQDSVSFRLFHVLPHDTLTVLAECYPLRTYTSAFRPRLINSNYIETFTIKSPITKKYVTIFTYILCGLLLMMILFSLANFLQGRNSEFLYYAGYAFFLGLMLFTKQFYYYRSY